MIDAALGTFVVVVVLTPAMAGLARRLDIVDRPGPLKVHTRPVPYLGGVAVFLGIAATLVFLNRPVLVVPLGMSLMLGLTDDFFDIAPPARLVTEIGIGIVSAIAVPSRFASPWGSILTVIAVVSLINATNLIDGLDGLAAGIGFAAAVGFAAVLPDEAGRRVAAAVAGALSGFLIFNRPPARVYLGDAGSYVVGMALAILLVIAWQPGGNNITAIGAPALVAVPVIDTVVTILRRLSAGRPVFEGDRGHTYDKLVDYGWSSRRSTIACIAAQALITIAVIAASSDVTLEITVVVTSLIVLLTMTLVIGFIEPTRNGTP